MTARIGGKKAVLSIVIIWRSCVCKFTQSLNVFVNHQLDTSCAFMVIHGLGQSGGKLNHLVTTRGWTKRCSPFSFKLTLQTSVLPVVYLVAHFLHFCASRWWFHCLKWLPSMVLPCCRAILSTQGWNVPSRENTGWAPVRHDLDSYQPWVRR